MKIVAVMSLQFLSKIGIMKRKITNIDGGRNYV